MEDIGRGVFLIFLMYLFCEEICLPDRKADLQLHYVFTRN